MDRRLHSLPFRKIQSYTSYKAVEKGFNQNSLKQRILPGYARYVAG